MAVLLEPPLDADDVFARDDGYGIRQDRLQNVHRNRSIADGCRKGLTRFPFGPDLSCERYNQSVPVVHVIPALLA